MQGLYAIVDVDLLARHGLEPVRFAAAVLQVRPAALQLRDKRCRARDTLALLRALLPLCRRAGVPLFANDRPDLAALAGCDGVHLGQHDLSMAQAHQVFAGVESKRPRIGLSVHNATELQEALRQAPDYIALGPVFQTRNRAQPEPSLGLETLGELAAQVHGRGLPSVAIGGIDRHNLDAVAERCRCVASIGALVPDRTSPEHTSAEASYHEVSQRAAGLHHALLRTSEPST